MGVGSKLRKEVINDIIIYMFTKGYIMSEDIKEKIKRTMREKKIVPVFGAGVETRFQNGHKHSELVRKKLSENNAHNKFWLGKNRPSPSEDTRLKMIQSALKGVDNPSWNGGVTSLRKIIRECFEYHFWRKKIFERDNYICLECGAKSSKGKVVVLNADHIKPFVVILEKII